MGNCIIKDIKERRGLPLLALDGSLSDQTFWRVGFTDEDAMQRLRAIPGIPLYNASKNPNRRPFSPLGDDAKSIASVMKGGSFIQAVRLEFLVTSHDAALLREVLSVRSADSNDDSAGGESYSLPYTGQEEGGGDTTNEAEDGRRRREAACSIRSIGMHSIHSKDLLLLAEGLERNRTVRSLSIGAILPTLSGCGLDAGWEEALVSSLLQRQFPINLALGGQGVTDFLLKILANAVDAGLLLESLWFYPECQLSNASARYLQQIIGSNLSILQALDLSCVPLDQESLDRIAHGLTHCKRLQSLMLRDGQAGQEETREEEGGQRGSLSSVFKALAEMKSSLKELEIYNLGNSSGHQLAKLLKTNTSLRFLKVHGGVLDGDTGWEIVNALTTNKSLVLVSLHDVQLSVSAWKEWAAVLRTNKVLEGLDLRRCGAALDNSAAASRKVWKDLGSAVGSSTVLKVISVNGCGLEDVESLTALVDGLKVNQSLNALLLDHNKLTNVSGLLGALESNKAMASLILDNNEITAAGAVGITQLLERNETLETLSLSSNPLGDDGAAAIGRGLVTNKKITDLYLIECNIGDEGCRGLAQGLKENHSLEALELDGANYLMWGVGNSASNRNGSACHAAAASSSMVGSAQPHQESFFPLDGEKGELPMKAKQMWKARRRSSSGCQSPSCISSSDPPADLLSKSAVSCYRYDAYTAAPHHQPAGTCPLLRPAKKITGTGAAYLAESLVANPSFEILELDSQAIDDKGTSALATLLEKNLTFHFLSLSQNAIGPSGAQRLATAMEKRGAKGLQHLSFYLGLDGNPIGDEGAVAFVELLKRVNRYPLLFHLSVGLDDLSYDGIKTLLEAVNSESSARSCEEEEGSWTEDILTFLRSLVP